MPSLVTLLHDAPIEPVMKAMERDGAVILKGLMS